MKKKTVSISKRPVKKPATVKKAVAIKKKKVTGKLPPKKAEVKPVKEPKKTVDKYLKVFEDESIEVFKEIGERIFRKELKWKCYSTENYKGVHVFLILKK